MSSTARYQLVLVVIRRPAILGAAIGEHTTERNPVVLVERQHPVIQQVGRGEGRLAIVQLGEAHLRVSINPRLLIDPAHTF